MKRAVRILNLFVLVVALLFGSSISAHAHSGRTDSSGGHRDNKNKSGLGYYHYHCGGHPAHLHPNGYCKYTDVFPKSVKLKVGKTTLGIGERTTIKASVSPTNACDTDVDLKSSNENVIEIDGDELVAVGYGTSTITGKSFNGKKKTVKITVKKIEAKKVTISSSHETDKPVYIGDSFVLSAAITPQNVDDPAIVWSSGNESIATVDQNGQVKTQAKGKVTFYAKAANGVKGQKTIEVQEKQVTNVTLSPETLNLLLQETHVLTATVTPADATHPEITWSSSDPAVVSVSETGEIVAVGFGTATVTATSTNKVTASVAISVTEIIAERIVIEGATELYLGKDAALVAKVYPENTTFTDVVWSSSNPEIADIDESGNLKGFATGVVTITATQKDVATSVEIEIKAKATEKIEIQSSENTNKLLVGDAMVLTATVYPEDVTEREVSWSSNNPAVATVEADGKVTGIAAGEAVIVASTKDGFTEEYKITVSHTVESFFAEWFSWIKELFS